MADFSIGIVGLDTLGSALIRRLNAQGIGTTGTDINSRLVQAHVAGGGSAPAGSPYDLAQVCNLILLAETGDETAREAVLGPIGIVHSLRPGTIVVDMSDTSPQTGPALARALYAKGAIWIEATPVGSVADVRSGKLTLLTAGPADALERIAHVLNAIAAKTLRLGELGTGPLAKALAAAYGAVSIAMHTEMLIVAKRSGLDPDGVLDALALLSPGIGTAPAALQAQVLSGRYEADVSSKRLQEDVGRVLDAARSAATPAMFLPLFASAALSATNSPHATGGALDVARWMADNAGVTFAAKPTS
jgi:3-hydroxyisobutyrate dehydrogenase-like beta-hydroxyacid dehydrogenase